MVWRARCATVSCPPNRTIPIACVTCRGKSCRSDNRCKDCHSWSNDCCSCVSEYMVKLSLQQEKKRKRKAKGSSSSFSDFPPSMPVPLRQLPSFLGTGVVTTTPSLLVCAVTFLAAAPFVPPVDVTPVEPNCKRLGVNSLREKVKMLTAFEELWASRRSLLLPLARCLLLCCCLRFLLLMSCLPSHLWFPLRYRSLRPAWVNFLTRPLLRPSPVRGRGPVTRLGLGRSRPRLPEVPSPLSGPVACPVVCPVPDPVPGSRLLPNPVPVPRLPLAWLPLACLGLMRSLSERSRASSRRSSSLWRLWIAVHCGRGLGHLAGCRLPPRVLCLLLWSLVCC